MEDLENILDQRQAFYQSKTEEYRGLVAGHAKESFLRVELEQLEKELEQELEELQERLGETKTEYRNSGRRLRTLHDSLGRCESEFLEAGVSYDEEILRLVVEAAEKGRERSELYFSGKGVEGEFGGGDAEADERVVAIYEENKDFPEILESLKPIYDRAVARQKERGERYMGVLVESGRESLGLYVTIEYDHQEEGLMENLRGAVERAVIKSGAKDLEVEDYKGLLRLTVLGTDKERLVEALRSQKPAEFDEARVGYVVLTCDSFEYLEETVGTSGCSGDVDEASDHLDGLVEASIDSGKPKKKKTTKKRMTKQSEGKEEGLGKGIALEELFSGEEYVRLDEVQAVTGINTPTFYAKGKYLDFKGGPIRTKLENEEGKGERLLELDSMIKLFGPIRMYTMREVAAIWKEREESIFGVRENPVLMASYAKKISTDSPEEKIRAFQKGGSKYAGENEVERYLRNKMAKTMLRRWKGELVEEEKVREVMGISKDKFRRMVESGVVEVEEGGKVAIDSLKKFVKSRRRDVNGAWRLKKLD